MTTQCVDHCSAHGMEPLIARPGHEFASSRIMIVDDVPLNIKILQAHLTSAGFSDFVSLTDSTQAIEAMYRNGPDILLLDIMMPDVSGLEILQTIRGDLHFARLPVLILTGADSREIKRESLELGRHRLPDETDRRGGAHTPSATTPCSSRAIRTTWNVRSASARWSSRRPAAN